MSATIDNFIAAIKVTDSLEEQDERLELEGWAYLIRTGEGLEGWRSRAAEALIRIGAISREGEILKDFSGRQS